VRDEGEGRSLKEMKFEKRELKEKKGHWYKQAWKLVTSTGSIIWIDTHTHACSCTYHPYNLKSD
jgi:hypothetical protein